MTTLGLSRRLRARIFATATDLWPRTPPDQRLQRLREMAADVNPEGGQHVSALKEYQARVVLAKLEQKRTEQRVHLASAWRAVREERENARVLDAMTPARFDRMVQICLQINFHPDQVLGILGKRIRNGATTSWLFRLDEHEAGILLKILESYRRKRRDFYYDSDEGRGVGPVRKSRRKKRKAKA